MSSPSLNRRRFALLAAAGAAAVAAPSLRAQGKPEKSKVSIAVGGKSAFYYLPLTISEQLGYFKAEVLDVEISDFAGGAKALQALVGGSADVVSGAYEHTTSADPPTSACSARAPPAKSEISTSSPSALK